MQDFDETYSPRKSKKQQPLQVSSSLGDTESMATMKAVSFDEPGGPEKLYIAEVKRPEPGQGEVLVKVYASAINRADTLQLGGSYNPPPGASEILGLEAAGEVVQLGPGCSSKWKQGDRVAALVAGGGNAEFVLAHEGHLMPMPSHMTMLEAAGIPEVWLTAYQLLHFVGHVKAGDRVLIHAGGSGVGTAAIQLVRLAGAEAIVTAGTQAKLDMAQELGAVAGFNYKQVDFADKVLEFTQNKGVDLILDCVGGSYGEKNLRVIAMEGTWVLYGLMGGVNVDGPILGGILRKRVTLVGTTLRTRSVEYKTDLVEAFTNNALPHFGTRLKPITDRVFPLEEIVDAHKYMAANKNIGKIVLKVHDEKPGTGHTEL
ncbi:quinone oxidoreductase PIG3-like isoform X2 [Patiria miniata]|uniref:Enoyl reductase (ER) domain-containing protein n=1 Tax=Patiria miniata TaxID=46514 RepID=A0A914BTC8_PATMI|nr:quinone oxidoreductase PIG3-like isoform X2 [Patiria miniata]XP_038078866.1 quinone oxidoreductase PIG3-like isoform X2 [Patiria miniata]